MNYTLINPPPPPGGFKPPKGFWFPGIGDNHVEASIQESKETIETLRAATRKH